MAQCRSCCDDVVVCPGTAPGDIGINAIAFYVCIEWKCLRLSVQLRHVYVVAIMLVARQHDEGCGRRRIMTLTECGPRLLRYSAEMGIAVALKVNSRSST